MNTQEKLDWFTVDTDTLPANVKSAWAKLKKAQEAVKLAKDDFEGAFVQSARKAERIDGDVQLRFGYNFGRLAIAKVEGDAKPKKSAKPKFSF